MIELKKDEVVIRIKAQSPKEVLVWMQEAIINSLRLQRENDLPLDAHDHNAVLLDLLQNMLPSERCLREPCE